MDVKSYLMSQGTDEETASEIASNPKFASVYEKAAQQAEDGKTAFMKAQEIQQSMKTWNETQVVPYVQKADREVAAERAKNAAMAAHMKTLKEQGYDIPDSYLTASETPTVNTPVVNQPNNGGVKTDDMLNYAKANMALISMSNKYRKLTGEELDPEHEYTDFQSNARPNENLRTYIDRKYDLSAKEAAKESERKQAYEKGIADAAVAKAQAEWQAKHGSNPEVRIAQSSKFDTIRDERKQSGMDSNGTPSWQTKAGRDQATQRRLEKYSSLIN